MPEVPLNTHLFFTRTAGNRFQLSESVCTVPNACPSGQYLDPVAGACMTCRDDSRLCLNTTACQLVETYDAVDKTVCLLIRDSRPAGCNIGLLSCKGSDNCLVHLCSRTRLCSTRSAPNAALSRIWTRPPGSACAARPTRKTA